MKNESGKTRGVESAPCTDMALIGSTEQELHTKSLPRRSGPNFGYGKEVAGSNFRADGDNDGSEY